MTTATAIHLNPTRNDIPEDERADAIELLQARLAEAVDLQSQLKVAHWNVKGPSFIALHELFDKLHDEVAAHVDDIAERLVALGGVARGTVRQAAATTTLPEYPLNTVAGSDHVDAVAQGIAAFGRNVRESIDAAGEIGDAGTEDLFTGISRSLDKALWFVEAHNAAKS